MSRSTNNACPICGAGMKRMSCGIPYEACSGCGALVRVEEPVAKPEDSGLGKPALRPQAVSPGLMTRLRMGYTLRRLAPALAGLGRDAFIVDVGYGFGLLMMLLARQGYSRVHGLQRAECPPALEGIDSRCFIDSSVEDSALPDASVDLAILVHVVEHLADPAECIGILRNAIKPGGLIYIMTPNGASSALRLLGRRWWFATDRTHYTLFTREALVRMLEDAGFEVLATARPAFDSVSAEAMSVLGPRGRMPAAICLALTALISALFIPLRLIRPSFRPSVEIIARRPA